METDRPVSHHVYEKSSATDVRVSATGLGVEIPIALPLNVERDVVLEAACRQVEQMAGWFAELHVVDGGGETSDALRVSADQADGPDGESVVAP